MLANELREEAISVNSVTPGYTATALNQNQGAKTVEQGALPIVKLVAESSPVITAEFFKDGGDNLINLFCQTGNLLFLVLHFQQQYLEYIIGHRLFYS